MQLSTGKILKLRGWKEGRTVGLAKIAGHALSNQGLNESEVLARLDEVLAVPSNFLGDPMLCEVASELIQRERSDISKIAEHYLDHFNVTFGAEVTGLAQDTLEGFLTHDWPGNVRELRNLLEGVFVVKRSSQITAADLPDWFSERLKNKCSVIHESSKILSVLLATNWNKSKAAGELHWSRMTLYRKLAKYNLHHVSN